MSKYRVTISYSGAISKEVEAGNEYQAEQLAKQEIARLDNDTYVEEMLPQETGTEIELIGRGD